MTSGLPNAQTSTFTMTPPGAPAEKYLVTGGYGSRKACHMFKEFIVGDQICYVVFVRQGPTAMNWLPCCRSQPNIARVKYHYALENF